MKYNFILGAPKCGTTFLAGALSIHTNSKLSRPKEPKFFTRDFYPSKQSLKNHLYDCYGSCHIDYNNIEANPMLLMAPYVPDRIKLLMSDYDLKFVVLLREQWTRMYSHWLMDLHEVPGRTYSTFKRMFQKNYKNFDISNFDFEGDLPMNKYGGLMVPAYIEYGLYYDQIKRYTGLFGKENILIKTQNELLYNTKNVLEEVSEFIGCEYNFDKLDLTKDANVSRERKSEMEVLEILDGQYGMEHIMDIYDHQNIKLFNEFGIQFGDML